MNKAYQDVAKRVSDHKMAYYALGIKEPPFRMLFNEWLIIKTVMMESGLVPNLNASESTINTFMDVEIELVDKVDRGHRTVAQKALMSFHHLQSIAVDAMREFSQL